MLSVFSILSFSTTAGASPVELIADFETALEDNDVVALQLVWPKLRDNSTAVGYMQANFPELHEQYEMGIEKLLGDMITRSNRDYDIGDLAEDFPLQDREDNDGIARAEKNQDRWNNRQIAMNFRNQDRPSNRELIKQRRLQSRFSNSYYDDDVEAAQSAFTMTVSGVSPLERASLKDILTDELGYIEMFKEMRFDKGVAIFHVVTSINIEDFTRRVENRDFTTFYLDLVSFTDKTVNFVLKHN